MNLYAMQPDMPVGPNDNVVMMETSNTSIIVFVVYAIVVLLGLFVVIKYIGKNNNTSIGKKVVSFLLPIIGIILYFVRKKENVEEAADCMKSAMVGIIIYILYVVITIVANILGFLFVTV